MENMSSQFKPQAVKDETHQLYTSIPSATNSRKKTKKNPDMTYICSVVMFIQYKLMTLFPYILIQFKCNKSNQ